MPGRKATQHQNPPDKGPGKDEEHAVSAIFSLCLERLFLANPRDKVSVLVGSLWPLVGAR